jgi:YD repeat-containing protein
MNPRSRSSCRVLAPLLLSALTILGITAASNAAVAACTSNTAAHAYGDFWIDRDTNATCDCLFRAYSYQCFKDGNGYNLENPLGPSLLYRLTASCGSTTQAAPACESLAGFDAAIAHVLTFYKIATIGSYAGYECDDTFKDDDGDLFGSCIDSVDTDPRKTVKNKNSSGSAIAERICDGYDSNGDGVVDGTSSTGDSFGGTACAVDQKRQTQANLFQGDSAGAVNLVDHNFLRRETDAVQQGPFGPTVFGRNYNSRRTAIEGGIGLGIGWTHTYSVYLRHMATGDGRWQVVTPSGEEQYFRCNRSPATNGYVQCANDDHRPQGYLYSYNNVFYWYPGNGTRWSFAVIQNPANSHYLWQSIIDSGGNTIATSVAGATSDQLWKIRTGNGADLLQLGYDASNNLQYMYLNGTSQIAHYFVITGDNAELQKVQYSMTLGSDDTQYNIQYAYSIPGTGLKPVITTISQSIDSLGGTIPTSTIGVDTSARVTSISDASKNIGIHYNTGYWNKARVTYKVASGNVSTSYFTSNGIWITSRNDGAAPPGVPGLSIWRVGGMAAASQGYDVIGRLTCSQTDYGVVSTSTYANALLPFRTDRFAQSTYSANCTSPGGTPIRQVWYQWGYDANTAAFRPTTVREASVTAPGSNCASMSSNCKEMAYTYASTTDDRVVQVKVTGNTYDLSGTNSSQIRNYFTYYYGRDACTGILGPAGSYSGLPCRMETQDSASNLFERSDFTYYVSTATAHGGLLKSASVWKDSSNGLTTQYSQLNGFGTPTVVKAPSGLVTISALNGWNAVTSVTEQGALLDTASPPHKQDTTTQYTYNNLRKLASITLPLGNQRIFKYFNDTTNYGRIKAWAKADTSGKMREIMRYAYDQFGNTIQERTLDGLSTSNPCYDNEDCTTYDTYHEIVFNANRQITAEHQWEMISPQPSSQFMVSNEQTKTYSYAKEGTISSVQDYMSSQTKYTYDSSQRIQKLENDATGIDQATTYAYDAHDQLLTTTSPTSEQTTTQRDDFGQLVYENVNTRGQIRYLYDSKGVMIERQRSGGSPLVTEWVCYPSDFLGRRRAIYEPASSTCPSYPTDTTYKWQLFYDGDSLPATACQPGTNETGHLSTITNGTVTGGTWTRAICHHPNGAIYGSFDLDANLNYWNGSDKGTTLIYNLNGDISHKYVWDSSYSSHVYTRDILYSYDSVLRDRFSYVQHKLPGDASYTDITSPTTLPTYFAFGGMKTLTYANGITETNARDTEGRLLERKTTYGTTNFTKIDLAYDHNGNVTTYDDSTGFRHMATYAAVDRLNRLRCLSRQPVASCSGTAPWANAFNESFDYDKSGNRQTRTYGQYTTSDQDIYTYTTGADTITNVQSGGTNYAESPDFRGEIQAVNQPEYLSYTFDKRDGLKASNDNFLGNVTHNYTPFGDRYDKVATCNGYLTRYYMTPGETGGSSELSLLDMYNSCSGPERSPHPGDLIRSHG